MMLIIQYNARSLTKANPIQFKSHLHKYKPHVALISETFWKDTFLVKFKNYNVINKNRQSQAGGGVALLIHKSLQFTLINLPDFRTIEAVGASIDVTNDSTYQKFDMISIYIPNGDHCDPEERRHLTQARNENIIICGDFNEHHGRWETSCVNSNQSGRAIANLLEDNMNIELATPRDLGIRQNPSTLNHSTIDLALMSPHLSISSVFTRGPNIGSDHLPIHIQTRARPAVSISRAPSWCFDKADWKIWNESLNEKITSSKFYTTSRPDLKYQIFHNAVLAATEPSNIFLSKPSRKLRAEPAQPWWNADCKKAVAQGRRARNACDPRKGGINCATNRAALREKDNKRDRIINKAKKDSLIEHIKRLNPKSNPARTWAFVKTWTTRIKPPDLNSSPLTDPSTNRLTTRPEEKAKILSSQYDHQKRFTPDNSELEDIINLKVNSTDPNALNSNVTQHELNYGTQNLTSNAMGRDSIHNEMFKKMSEFNKRHLLHMLNTMLFTTYVPPDWKHATIIPLCKLNKPPENPESYRLISLTSCLGKIMERIVNQRLTRQLENMAGLRLKTQCGFRKGRSTMDNIIALEHFIREGLNHTRPLNTYAVFLDVAKAFDTVWIQCLLFKLSTK